MIGGIGIQLLNEIIINRSIKSPDQVLNTLRNDIIQTFNHEGATEERKEGLDISLCKITGNKLEVSCANNPVFIVRDKTLIEIKQDRFPIGMYIGEMKSFTLKEFILKKGDILFTFSDGYADQFSEKSGKKILSKRFKEWLCELSFLEMPQIKMELECRFEIWKGNNFQVDDVTIFAVKF